MGEKLPLAVDLDGTVILSDMTKISAQKIILRRPWYIFLIPFFELTKGRPYWKKRVAKLVSVKPEDLEYHDSFINWLKKEELMMLKVWCLASFGKYNDIIIDTFENTI